MRALKVTRIAVAVAATAALVVGVDVAQADAGTGTSTPVVQPTVSPTSPGTNNNPWD